MKVKELINLLLDCNMNDNVMIVIAPSGEGKVEWSVKNIVVYKTPFENEIAISAEKRS